MDLSSILPLLMGGKNPDMAKILSAMNGSKPNGGEGGGMNEMLASLLSSQKKTSEGGRETNKASGIGQTELLMSLMNSMNKQKPPRAFGLSVIQKIAPNDILGILVKYFGKRDSKERRN